ncbi:hypothetical protein Dimus_031148 [Dionaea muscipula]
MSSALNLLGEGDFSDWIGATRMQLCGCFAGGEVFHATGGRSLRRLFSCGFFSVCDSVFVISVGNLRGAEEKCGKHCNGDPLLCVTTELILWRCEVLVSVAGIFLLLLEEVLPCLRGLFAS